MEQLRHPVGKVKEWNESYYFNFYDHVQDIGGFTRIGFKPNREKGTGYLFLLIDHHEINTGFIMRRGENVPVKKVSAHTVSEKNIQKEFEYEIKGTRGDYCLLTGSVLKTVQIPYQRKSKTSILNENLSQFACNKKKGFGITEYLVKI